MWAVLHNWSGQRIVMTSASTRKSQWMEKLQGQSDVMSVCWRVLLVIPAKAGIQ
jgi:hypothetical protein